jgi:hypothetical protein
MWIDRLVMLSRGKTNAKEGRGGRKGGREAGGREIGERPTMVTTHEFLLLLPPDCRYRYSTYVIWYNAVQ